MDEDWDQEPQHVVQWWVAGPTWPQRSLGTKTQQLHIFLDGPKRLCPGARYCGK